MPHRQKKTREEKQREQQAWWENLQADPSYQEAMKEKERVQEGIASQTQKDAAPIVAELQKAGFRIERLWDLTRIKEEARFAKAVPVLLEWLPRLPVGPAREAIVRALGTPIAKPAAARPLLEEFRRVDPTKGLDFGDVTQRWVIGNSLVPVADNSIAEEIIELARDRRYGRAREMLTLALGALSAERVVPALVELLADDEVCGHAVMALGQLRAASARQAVLPFLRHPKEWIRKEALRAVKRIDGGR